MALFEQKAPGIMALLMQDFAPLTVEDAAAPLGNFGEESGGFALLQEQSPLGGGAGGYGWAQWTGARRGSFTAYCSRNNLDPKSDKANYGFLFVELKGAYAHVFAAVRAAVGLEAKVKAFMDGYEMPNAAYAHLDVRVAFAEKAIAAYKAAPQPVAPMSFGPVPVNPPRPPAPVPSTQPDDPGVGSTPTPPQPTETGMSANFIKGLLGTLMGFSGIIMPFVPAMYQPIVMALIGLFGGGHAITSATSGK